MHRVRVSARRRGGDTDEYLGPSRTPSTRQVERRPPRVSRRSPHLELDALLAHEEVDNINVVEKRREATHGDLERARRKANKAIKKRTKNLAAGARAADAPDPLADLEEDHAAQLEAFRQRQKQIRKQSAAVAAKAKGARAAKGAS